jgi:hypothetical protein
MEVDQLRNSLLDKIISVTDKNLLEKINEIIGDVDIEETEMKVSDAQRQILTSSEKDIEDGNVISDEELNDEEDKWLKG